MKLLLYNLSQNLILKQTLSMMNIQCFHIESKDYNKTIKYLLGLDSNSYEDSGDDFLDEMIIMYEFSDEQLETLLSILKINNIKIPLKAIVTDTNINWNSIQIRNELIKEHSYMQKKRNF